MVTTDTYRRAITAENAQWQAEIAHLRNLIRQYGDDGMIPAAALRKALREGPADETEAYTERRRRAVELRDALGVLVGVDGGDAAMVTDTYDRALALRNAVAQMAIRYGSSTRETTYAVADGRWEVADRYRRASRRQFIAIQRLTNALAELAT